MTAITAALTGNVSTETLLAISVDNIVLTTQDTEYPYTFPAGTKSFSFQNRGDGTVKLRTTTGGVYWTFFPGQPYYISNVRSSATITVIFESATAAQTIEIISWT